MNINRLKRVIDSMKEKNIYQFVITDRMSIYYLTNINIHSGERFLGLYINQDNEVHLINNYLFPLSNNDIDILYYSDTESAVKKMSKFVHKDKNIGIDKSMTSNFLLEMMDIDIAANYINASPCMDYVRMQKDEDEIKKMMKASEINDKRVFTSEVVVLVNSIIVFIISFGGSCLHCSAILCFSFCETSSLRESMR